MLRAEFQSLKMSFDQHRQKSSGKRRIVYPAELRKRASALVSQGTRPVSSNVLLLGLKIPRL